METTKNVDFLGKLTSELKGLLLKERRVNFDEDFCLRFSFLEDKTYKNLNKESRKKVPIRFKKFDGPFGIYEILSSCDKRELSMLQALQACVDIVKHNHLSTGEALMLPIFSELDDSEEKPDAIFLRKDSERDYVPSFWYNSTLFKRNRKTKEKGGQYFYDNERVFILKK